MPSPGRQARRRLDGHAHLRNHSRRCHRRATGTRRLGLGRVILGNRTSTRAQAQAGKHGIAEWGSGEDVLNHPDVELIVNLTIPAVHATVASASLAAGKHVWSEKPISIDRASGQALLEQAQVAGLLVGVAPDTVLGPGLQTARRAIARGEIGTPLSAQAVIQYPGPEIFHPNPEFLFAEGAGPLYDVGPYCLTALVHVFGPFAKVAAVGSKGRATRTIQVGDRAGSEFPVAVPTHVGAIAQFAGGGVALSRRRQHRRSCLDGGRKLGSVRGKPWSCSERYLESH